jgi:hypothetical protein
MTNPQILVDPSSFPRWVYGPQLPKGKLIHNPAELLALKGEWFSHPDQREDSRIDLPAPEPVVTAESIASADKGKGSASKAKAESK